MYTAAVITVSDRISAGLRVDESGSVVAGLLEEAGYQVVLREIVPDERVEIESLLVRASDAGIALIVTTGGTGFSPRDVTPEATIAVCERMTPGIGEAMRAFSLQITPRAMLSRGVCGIRGRSLIVNLPGSPRAARENLASVLPTLGHGISVLAGDVSECASVGRVVSVHVSERKGEPKQTVPSCVFRTGHGIEGDAHGGTSGHRQVSLLGLESVDTLRDLLPDIAPGAFADNVLTSGIALSALLIGTRLQIGAALCVVSQIGKECHDEGCAIRQAVGDCVMPREGVFVEVRADGMVRPGDEIRVL